MTGRNGTIATAPHFGGKYAVVLFIFTLIAYVSESELTQYVQTTLGYRQPYFLFYIAHSALILIFPFHLLYLVTTTHRSSRSFLTGLSLAITRHLSPSRPVSSSARIAFYTSLPLILLLTVGLTAPALIWFAAISMASVSDVTAIWNTNALWCWVFTVWLFKLKWESRRLLAVLLATIGVFAVVYGGSETPEPSTGSSSLEVRFKPTAPMLGDVITLVASLLYALYQVLYKKYAALPSDPELASEGLYERVSSGTSEESQSSLDLEDAVDPPPFGFHPNFLTSGVGLCTFTLLWVPIPILHYLDIERFSFPSDLRTVLALAGLSLSGVVFNGGFMTLLGLWGPIIISVGNLLTIVLVVFIDVLLGAADSLTLWSIIGSGLIVASFGILAYDMFRER